MLTVLLATRNRASLLHDVLEAYCQLHQPSSGWKVVIVNNGSTDQTEQVIASFADRLPIQSVLEPRLGKNHALNTGLHQVEGDLTVLTDDDAFPSPDWLVHLRKAADEQPEYSMFGGSVTPRWEVAPPSWIRWINLGPIFTITPPYMKEGPIPAHLIFGPNMAIRSSVFQSGIRFDVSIGPRGASYPMGSETEILLRLSRQGSKSWHVPQAAVKHFVRKAQLEETWVMQRAIRFGRGQYRLTRAEQGSDSSSMPAIWIRIVSGLLRESLVIAAAWLLRKQSTLLRARWRFNCLLGEAIEARIMKRDRHAGTKNVTSMSAPYGEPGERNSS